MSKQSIFLTIVFFGVLWGCNSSSNSDFRDRFRWLSGKWQGQNGSVTLIERWQWNKDAYTGEAFEIDANGDTLFSERLYLRSFQGVNGYLALLPNQQLTLFSGIKADENIWEFKNEDHDFPSLIQYHLEGDSTITVTLLAKGEPMSGEFSYQLRRVK